MDRWMLDTLALTLVPPAQQEHEEDGAEQDGERAHCGDDDLRHHLHVAGQRVCKAPMTDKRIKGKSKASGQHSEVELSLHTARHEAGAQHSKGWWFSWRQVTVADWFSEHEGFLPWISLRILAAELRCSSNKRRESAQSNERHINNPLRTARSWRSTIHKADFVPEPRRLFQIFTHCFCHHAMKSSGRNCRSALWNMPLSQFLPAPMVRFRNAHNDEATTQH